MTDIARGLSSGTAAALQRYKQIEWPAQAEAQMPASTPSVHAEIDTLHVLLSHLEELSVQLGIRLACVSEPESANSAMEGKAPEPSSVLGRLAGMSARVRDVNAGFQSLLHRLHV